MDWILNSKINGLIEAFPGWMKPEAGVVKAMVEIG